MLNDLVTEPDAALELTELIGSGNDRECWRHPGNPQLCIKVAKPEQERPQNEIDAHYAKHLLKRNISGAHIPAVHGWVATNKGPGLVFDLVMDDSGQPSQTLLKSVHSGALGYAQARALIDEAFDWLIKHKVILADYGIDNLLVRRSKDGGHHLVFIDGLGARNFGWNYWLNRLLPFKAVKKAREFRLKTIQLLDQSLCEPDKHRKQA